MRQMNPTTGRALVSAFERSDKRVMHFCEVQGISYAVLKYWRNRIAEIDQQKKTAFVKVEVPPKERPIGNVEVAAMVILPNQARIAFQNSSDLTPQLIEAFARC